MRNCTKWIINRCWKYQYVYCTGQRFACMHLFWNFHARLTVNGTGIHIQFVCFFSQGFQSSGRPRTSTCMPGKILLSVQHRDEWQQYNSCKWHIFFQLVSQYMQICPYSCCYQWTQKIQVQMKTKPLQQPCIWEAERNTFALPTSIYSGTQIQRPLI